MFERSNRSRVVKSAKRLFRMSCERLEDRWVPDARLDFATEFKAGITADAAPAGIVEGADGNIWFAEFNSSKIARITSAGVVTEFTLPAGRGPLNITQGPDNLLYFTENSGDRIGRINPSAGSDTAIQASIVEFIVPGAGSAPNDIVAGPDGALWFTQSGSDQIGRLKTDGTLTSEFAVPGAGSAPSGICSGPDGALWFTQGGSGQIGRITTAGSFTEFTVPVDGAGFSDPEDITAGPGGHLYFTDFGRSQVGRITVTGEIFQFSLPANRGPHDIVAGQDGAIYFTEAASSRIGRLPASAFLPGKATSGQPPLKEYDYMAFDDLALGITSTKSGDLWFTQNHGNAVTRFKLPLVQITAAATGPNVSVFDIKLKTLRSFQPYPGFTGNVSVAIADFNGDNTPDLITAPGPGGGSHIKVYDGFDNELFVSFFAYDPSFRGGVSLAADHFTADGNADIVIAPISGSQPIRVLDATKLKQLAANGVIAESALLGSFFAFDPSFSGGVSLGAGDINGDNLAELVVGAGPGGGSFVKVIDAAKFVTTDALIPDSSLLAHFQAFAPGFNGGVFVAVGYENGDNVRDVIVGAGVGGGPHVKIVDGTKLATALGGGALPASATVSSFFAFGPTFRGGVRVSADDLNADGQTEVILSAGPGGGPHVKVINATGLNQLQANGVIADSAVILGFFAEAANNTAGVFIASDADHRDGPIFGPPGVNLGNSRRDVNDIYVFQSPVTPTNTVMVLDVSPFSTAATTPTFAEGGVFDFRIANRDLLNTTDDMVFRASFGPPDAAASMRQDVSIRALPASRFTGTGGVIVKGFTGQNLDVRGAGGNGTARFRAAEQDDPFFFDAAGFSTLLNNATAVQGVVDGEFPRGTSPNGFGPGSTPNYDAPNFFAKANTLSMILEIPSDRLIGPAGDAIGVWARSEFNGVQVDRMGRPGINTALISPVPRGAQFPIGGTSDINRQDVRNAFNAGHPRNDRAGFQDDMTAILAAFYPAGRPGGVPSPAQASVVSGLLLPDILVFRPSNAAGFGGDLATSNGSTFLAGGRKLSDDVITTELQVLTDDDLPIGLGGGPNQPALVTQNVADDNGLGLTDGSVVGPGSPFTGMTRPALFPYIGAPNTNPNGVPGGNPLP